MAESHYNERGYRRFIAELADRPQVCWICGRYGATSGDHVPAIAAHRGEHVEGSGCCEYRPAHVSCNKSQGAKLGNGMRHGSVSVTAVASGVW